MRPERRFRAHVLEPSITKCAAVLARHRVVVHPEGMERDAASPETYIALGGSRLAQTSEELAEAFAGFPERVAELRARRICNPLTEAEQEELRLLEEILNRSAPWLLLRE